MLGQAATFALYCVYYRILTLLFSGKTNVVGKHNTGFIAKL